MKIYEVPEMKQKTEMSEQELEIVKAKMMTFILSGFHLNSEPKKVIEY